MITCFLNFLHFEESVLWQEEKQKIQNDLRILTERLSRLNDSLARKVTLPPVTISA